MAPAPAPARRTRTSQVSAPPAEVSADELEMDEPVKPVRKTRAPAKKVEPEAKEGKATGPRKTATRASTKSTAVETVKPKATRGKKVKEVKPIAESEQEEEGSEAEGSLAAVDEEKGTGEPVPTESATVIQEQPPVPVAEDATDDEEDEEPTIRRAPSSAPRQSSSQPQPSSRRPSAPIPVPAQTEDDALSALLTQSQHRSIHNQRTTNPIPQTPVPGRTIPQTPAQATARTRFVPGTVQGTATKGKSGLFPQTPGGLGRTPGPAQLGMEQVADVKPVAAPKKRLVIHKLVLVDFKSYAGRQEIGPFHKVRLYFGLETERSAY